MNKKKAIIPRSLKKWFCLIIVIYSVSGLITAGSSLKSDEKFHGWLYYWDGPFRGRAVDLNTGEPIEGAVVAGSWYLQGLFGLPIFCDAVETVTDKDGEFNLPKAWCVSILPIGKLSVPGRIIVFKPGYLAYPPLGATEDERKSHMPDWGNPRLFENNNQYNVVKLGKPLSLSTRRLTFGNATFADDNTRKRVPQLMAAINRERIYLGLHGIEK